MRVKNRIKGCLAKIKVAQIERKKVLFIESLILSKKLLDALWQKGFIYGYNETMGGCVIFLKYKSCGAGVLECLKFVTDSYLSDRLLLNSYVSYIMMPNNCQVQIFSGNTIEKNSGKLIAII